MGRGRAARRGDRGGGSIPSLGASSVRLVVSGVALLLAAALAGYPLAGSGDAASALLPVAAGSLVLVALSLRWVRLLALVLIALAAELVMRTLDSTLPPAAVVAYGAGLLLLCELLSWAATLHRGTLLEPAVVTHRVGRLCAVALLGAAASALTTSGSGISPPNAFVAGVAGAAAVAALLALVWALGREVA